MHLLKRNPVMSFFILTFVFTWFFWLIAVLSSNRLISLPFPEMVLVVIGAHGPLLASFGLVFIDSGTAGMKHLLCSGFQLKMKPRWWSFILVFPVLLAALAFWINSSTTVFEPDTTLLSQPLLIIPNLVFMFFLGGSFQEEFGWRGYALPRMLSAQSPFKTSLLLGLVWGFWHLPLFMIDGLSQSYMNFGFFMLLTLAFSFIFTWLFVKTEFNLFSALLLHTTLNSSLNIFPPIEQTAGGNQTAFIYLSLLYLVAALLLVLKDRKFWFKIISNVPEGFLPPDSTCAHWNE